MPRDIHTDLIADDHMTPAFKAVARQAGSTAAALDTMNESQRSAALAAVQSSQKVERASRDLAKAQARYGATSLEARAAALKLRVEQDKLSTAGRALDVALTHVVEVSRETTGATDDMADAVMRAGVESDRASRAVDRLRGGMGKLGAVTAPVVLGMGKAAGVIAAVGGASAALATGIVPAAVGLGKLATAGWEAGAQLAPMAAVLPALAAGFHLARGTLMLASEEMIADVKPITDAWMAQRRAVGYLATRSLPEVSSAFVKVNFPAVARTMREIARDTDTVIDRTGRWVNSAPGQRAIRQILGATADESDRLARIMPGVAASFLAMSGRAAGPGLERLGGYLEYISREAVEMMDSVSGEDVTRAFDAFEAYGTKLKEFGTAVRDVGGWLMEADGRIRAVSDTLSTAGIVIGILTGNPIPVLMGSLTLLVTHWDQVTGAVRTTRSTLERVNAEYRVTERGSTMLSQAVSGLAGWYDDYLAPAMSAVGRVIMPVLRSAAEDMREAWDRLSDETAFATGALKVIGGIMIGVLVVAIGITVGAIKTFTTITKGIAWALDEVVIPAIMGFATTVREMTKQAIGDFRAMPGQIRGFFTGAGDWLRGAGGDIIDGLLDGASAVVDTRVGGWARSIGDRIVSHVKDVFGIKSPSRVFMGLGGQLMEGLALGVIRNNPEKMITKVFGSTTKALGHMVSDGLISAANLSQKALGAIGSSIVGMFPSGGGGNSSNRALGQMMAQAYGWSGIQWAALDKLIMGESGWRSDAQNPTSTAFGIFQFLNSTWSGVGATKTSNPAGQIAAGLKYISMVYGSPLAAYSAWQSRSPHWYDAGGIAAGPGFIPKLTNRPERILSPRQTVAFERLVRVQERGGSAAGVTLVVNAPNYIGSRSELRETLLGMVRSGSLDAVLRGAR